MEKYSFIDVFAGAGGLAEGFIANNFKPMAHIEMNKNACDTLTTRLSYYFLKKHHKLDIYHKYLNGIINRDEFLSYIPDSIKRSVINKTISDENIEEIFEFIDTSLNPKGVHVDVLVGGPPCQAYSLVGRAVSGKKIQNDPRNFLYKLYVKFLERFQPKVFVFENVQGLLSANNGFYLNSLKNCIESAGYNINLKVLTVSDYGVLQNRRRVIIIGIRKDLPVCDLYPDKSPFAHQFYVNDIFSDLPSLSKDLCCNKYLTEPTKYCSISGIRTNDDILTWHLKRPNNEHDREIYRMAIDLWNTKRKRIKYTDIPVKMRTHKNQKAFLDRFKVVASNEHESQTILAHLSKDGHYFIHPDKKQCRSISVREAARLQSFPDSYFFEGSRGAAFTQIGNAVPPLLSNALAKKIKKYLEEK